MESARQTSSIAPETHIGSVTIKVSNLARSLVFYKDVIGFKSVAIGDNRARLETQDGLALLHLEELPGAHPRPHRSTGLYHFAILVPDRQALGASFQHLIKTGYPLTGAADHLVSDALYLSDPDKNGIEIYRDRPRGEWTFDGSSVQMANEPVDLESLSQEAGSNSFQGLRAGTTMGHIHLHVRDLREAEKFYCEILGFDVMLRWPPSALFTSAGGYHHHIGLNTWAGVGAPPPPKESAGLDYFEIVLPNEDARNDVMERLKQAGVPTSEDSGLLLHDPSGNGIKLIVG